MSAKVVLQLGSGDWQQGFPFVTLELWNQYKRLTRWTGSLPPCFELSEAYREWQNLYEALCNGWPGWRSDIPPEFELDEEVIDRASPETFAQVSQEIKNYVNEWLDTQSFSHLEEQLRSELHANDEVQFIIETEDPQLRKFPWHLWNFFDDFPYAESALSPWESREHNSYSKVKGKVRILAIFGNSHGIDIDKDRNFLEQLPPKETDIKFLVKPEYQELYDYLWDKKGWDILFFAGHSWTRIEDDIGHLALNDTEVITIAQLKNCLKRAIANGLKLAIFNSCDGLGLAKQLASLNFPQMIVMRENVPDLVAQRFLQYFLTAFSEGSSFYLSVRDARERLQPLEKEFFCSTWLPVICQNPLVTPPTWEELRDKKEHNSRPKLSLVFLASIIVALLTMGLRGLGLWQSLELQAFDYLMQQRPTESADNRLMIIGIDEQDIQKYGYPIPDEVLLELLEKLQSYQPASIGIDIFRDLPVPSNNSQDYQALTNYMGQNANIVGICAGKTLADSVAGPQGIPLSQVAFVDLYDDRQPTSGQDDSIRRYVLFRSPNPTGNISRCNSSYSFAWQLIDNYLNTQNIEVKVVEEQLQFGSVIIPRLRNKTGAYQNLDDRGYQVLINYRHGPEIAQQFTVRDILENSEHLNPNWFKNHIILIGVVTDSVPRDVHDTPYGEIRGVYIHAHVVSQVLSAVSDDRPLFWSFPQWGDFLWVWSCSFGAGLIVWGISRPLYQGGAISIYIIFLYGVCWFVFIQGVWLPLVPSLLAIPPMLVILHIWHNKNTNNPHIQSFLNLLINNKHSSINNYR